jgi:hypothetical protein
MTTDARPSPEEAFAESPFDFNGYLARRLGISREAAMSDLGHWLVRHEHVGPRRAQTRRVRPSRSGVFPMPGKTDTSTLTSSARAAAE